MASGEGRRRGRYVEFSLIITVVASRKGLGGVEETESKRERER